MKKILLLLLFGLFLFATAFAQEPKTSFFKLFTWGEGAAQGVSYETEEMISRYIAIEDGYVIQQYAHSNINNVLMSRFSKIDFDFNEQWRVDFDGFDSLDGSWYRPLPYNETQHDIIIEDKLYTVFDCKIDSVRGQVYQVIDVNTGEKLYTRLLKTGEDGLSRQNSFYQYQDSLFMFAGWASYGFPFVPTIHIMNRKGEIVEKIIIDEFVLPYPRSIKLIKVKPKEGGFDFLYRKIEEGGAFPPNKFYSGSLDSFGFVKNQEELGVLNLFGLTKTYRSGVSVQLDNGNRFVVANLDTNIVNNKSSDLYATFLLEPNGSLIKDSIYNLSPDQTAPTIQDTAYLVGGICKLKNGHVVVAGSIETFTEADDNSLELFIIKYDETGEFLWRRRYDPFPLTNSVTISSSSSLNQIRVSQVHEDKDGGILIGGQMEYLFLSNFQFGYTGAGFLLKLGSDGCFDGDCSGILLANEDPLFDKQKISVNLYPNPVVAELTIEVLGAQSYDVEVLSLDGQVLFAKANIQQSRQALLTRKWPQGIYFVQVKAGSRTFVKSVHVVR